MRTIERLPPPIRRVCTLPLGAAAVLMICYLSVSAAANPNGYLGTDTGTKTYTLEVMSQNDTFSPDIGYWAEDQDPGGALHPVHQTRRQPDGSWVGVTTLPMLVAAQPLYQLGGYRAALLLPMLGGVAAAFAARAVMRRLAPADGGWAAYWMIGLGSPVFVYALDFWEHSAGVACVVGAVAVLLGVLQDRPTWTAALAGGLLGVGAVMRQEVLIYAAVLLGVTCALLLARRRSIVRPIAVGAASALGFAVPWLLNGWLETSLEGASRASRSTGTAVAAASGTSPSVFRDRVEEGAQTFVGLLPGDPVLSVLLGMAVVAAVAAATRAERLRDPLFANVAIGAVAVVYLADAAGGLGFVPGLLTAFPLAIGGVIAWRTGGLPGAVIGVALATLPLVYAFQYLGGAAPQWGGRYTLASGVLLGIVALVVLPGRSPLVLSRLVLLSVLVTLLGVAWLVERSHGADRFFDELLEVAEPVVIARQAFLLREAGPELLDRRWLSVENEREFGAAVDVARMVGEERFTVLEWEGEAPPDEALPTDVREVGRASLRFVNTQVGVVTYEFVEP